MSNSGNPTRRTVLLAAAGAPLAFAQQSTPTKSANDRIQIALIGAGGQGMADVRMSIGNGAKLVAELAGKLLQFASAQGEIPRSTVARRPGAEEDAIEARP